MFWKFLIFFAEILEKHQKIIFFFHIAASRRATLYTFTTKVIKITSTYQMFQPDPQLATIQNYCFKKHLFFQHSLSSYFCKLYCSLLHYSASLINLFSSVCAYTLKFAFPNLLKLTY